MLPVCWKEVVDKIKHTQNRLLTVRINFHSTNRFNKTGIRHAWPDFIPPLVEKPYSIEGVISPKVHAIAVSP